MLLNSRSPESLLPKRRLRQIRPLRQHVPEVLLRLFGDNLLRGQVLRTLEHGHDPDDHRLSPDLPPPLIDLLQHALVQQVVEQALWHRGHERGRARPAHLRI